MSHAGAIPDLTPAQRRMFRGSFYLFVIAEALIFVTLFSTRFLLAGTGHPAELNQTLGLAISALLVVSIAPLIAGLARIRRGARGAGLFWLAMLIGLAAIALIVYDWSALPVAVGSRFGENYVLGTGYHALHILIGVIALAVIGGADARRAFTPANHWQAEAASVFWLFVVASWIGLYLVFFIA